MPRSSRTGARTCRSDDAVILQPRQREVDRQDTGGEALLDEVGKADVGDRMEVGRDEDIRDVVDGHEHRLEHDGRHPVDLAVGLRLAAGREGDRRVRGDPTCSAMSLKTVAYWVPTRSRRTAERSAS